MSPIQPELFEFLSDLKQNNTKPWFQENRHRYEAFVKGPLIQFISDFQAPLASINPHFTAIPKVGGSLFRIYRDVRFSKDKSPYKTSAGVHFRHKAGKGAHAPGFYLHLAPGEVFGAVGIWGPDHSTLTKLRGAIVEQDEEWERLTTDARFSSVYKRAMQGDELKRPPRGFDPNHRFVEDLKRRHHVAVVPLTEAAACSPDFIGKLAESFAAGTVYMEFLTRALGLDW